MARVKIHQQDKVSDPDILGMFEWVTAMEGKTRCYESALGTG